MSLKRIKELIQQNKNDLALQEIEQLPNEYKIEGKIYESIIRTRKKDFKTALSIANYILSEKDLQISLIQEFRSRIAKMQALLRSRRFYEIPNEIE